jgi:hypothetical protein
MTAPSSSDTILDAVSRFLRNELLPTLNGRNAFQLRVCINAIDLVIRAIAHGAQARAIDTDGLATLMVGFPSEPTAEALCAAIECGDTGLDVDALFAHLRRVTVARLAIDQPSYSAFRAAADAGECPW